MQMGRWFGYRTGYLDCCKLFTTSENIEKFNEASLIIEDLENKFKYLAGLPGRTPGDFTLWVRNNPDVIKLTRNNFLRGLSAKSLSFEDTVQQSTHFRIDKDGLEKAFNAFRKKFATIEWVRDKEHSRYLIYDTDQNGLMEFMDPAIINLMLNLNILGLKEYLEICNDHSSLRKWRIAVSAAEGSTGGPITLQGRRDIHTFNKATRSGPRIGKNLQKPLLSYNSLVEKDIFKSRNSTIITPDAFSLCLTETEIDQVKRDFRKIPGNKGKTIPDRKYRERMDPDRGLLVIYLMDLVKIFDVPGNNYGSGRTLQDYAESKDISPVFQEKIPLIGYALGFPTSIGVKGDNFVTQHVYKEPEEMTLEELIRFVEERDFEIDLDSRIWSKKELLKAIYDDSDDDMEIFHEADEEN